MSAFCPVEQLKRAVGEKELPPELERSGDFIIISVEGKLFLLSKKPMALERLGLRFLRRVGRYGLSCDEQESLASRLADCRDYLPLELRHRLDGAIMARPQLVAEALKRGDIPLYRISKPAKNHAPAKKLSMPLVDELAAPPAQTGIPKPKTPTHWVEFCYQYEDNQKPISNVPFVLTMPDGSEINGVLPDNGKVRIEDIKKPGEASIAYGEPNAEQEADQLRQEIKQALDTIIEEERKEAAEIDGWYDEYNGFSQFFIRQYYAGKGIVNGAWGLFQWVGDVAEAFMPFGVMDSMIQAGIQQKYDYQNDEWKQDFLKNFTEEHKKKLVDALGFDPSSISRDNLAEAYETYVLIKNDPESKKLIWGFIEDYVDAQHELEVIESGGELGFEFIFAAVLAAFTGGTGAATLAPRLGSKMPKLGQKFRQLATAIKKVKLRKTTKGHTNKSTTTNVKRPEKKKLEVKPVNIKELQTPSSGVPIRSNPNKTTTILGNYDMDMKRIIKEELKYPKTNDFGAKPNNFNVLNVPDNWYKNADQFWNDYNKPFLDEAIQRGDDIVFATSPLKNPELLKNGLTGKLTGFGREYYYLKANGYSYNPATSMMVRSK